MRSFLLIAAVTIAATIGCTYKSAGSQSSTVGSAATQTSPEPATQTQEKVPCTLTLAGAPTIKGLKLGMTPDEVLDLFPGSKDDAEVRASVSKPPTDFGVSNFVIRPAQYKSKDNFIGINQVSLNLIDGRVTTLTVGYDGPAYSHVDKFVETIEKESTLPPVDEWEAYVGMDTQMKTLKCKEFEVQAFVGGPGGNANYVLVRDLVADRKLRDRKAKARAQAAPTPNR